MYEVVRGLWLLVEQCCVAWLEPRDEILAHPHHSLCVRACSVRALARACLGACVRARVYALRGVRACVRARVSAYAGARALRMHARVRALGLRIFYCRLAMLGSVHFVVD